MSKDNSESYAALIATSQNENEETSAETASEDHPHEMDLPEDAYGAAIFAFIYDARELWGELDHDAKPCWLNTYRLCYVIAVLLVNYMFQFLMLYWIFDFVVQPSVHSVQQIYLQFHAEYFSDSGTFLQDEWDSRQSKHDVRYKKQLCHMVFSKFTFLYFVLMLWVMIMVIEARRNIELLRCLYQIPITDRPELMVKSSGGGFAETSYDDDKLVIVALTSSIRITIIVIILLPKFGIGFILTMMGMIWLSATESFSELILNSLALDFVITIDDRLFHALLPEQYRVDMKKVKLSFPKKHVTLEDTVQEDIKDWGTSTFFFVFIPSFVYVYLKLLQFLPLLGVLPFFKSDIQEACEPFLQSQRERLCESGYGSVQCFAYGMSAASSRLLAAFRDP